MFNFLTDLAGKFYPVVKCLPKSLITNFPYCFVLFCAVFHHLMDRFIPLMTPFKNFLIKWFDFPMISSFFLRQCSEFVDEIRADPQLYLRKVLCTR